MRLCRPVSKPSSTLALVIVGTVAALLAGCGGDAATAGAEAAPAPTADDSAAPATMPAGDLEAVALELGSRLDTDGRVAVVQEHFRPGDTVQASLVTVGSTPAARLRVEWRDVEGRVLATDERSIAPAGPAVHRFSRAVEGGWPAGRYVVEVHLDATSAGLRHFEVR